MGNFLSSENSVDRQGHKGQIPWFSGVHSDSILPDSAKTGKDGYPDVAKNPVFHAGNIAFSGSLARTLPSKVKNAPCVHAMLRKSSGQFEAPNSACARQEKPGCQVGRRVLCSSRLDLSAPWRSSQSGVDADPFEVSDECS
jgi:hypothetical protein